MFFCYFKPVTCAKLKGAAAICQWFFKLFFIFFAFSLAPGVRRCRFQGVRRAILGPPLTMRGRSCALKTGCFCRDSREKYFFRELLLQWFDRLLYIPHPVSLGREIWGCKTLLLKCRRLINSFVSDDGNCAASPRPRPCRPLLTGGVSAFR